MPVSEKPLVERIARVLAGAAHSSNAQGSDPSAGEKVDLVWREHVNKALAVLHTMREPDGHMAAAGDVDSWTRWSRPPSGGGSAAIEPARARQPRADPRWTLVACVLASSLSFVEGSVLNVALPAIRLSYGAGAAEVQWVVNTYLLPLVGSPSARRSAWRPFRATRLLVIGTAIFASRRSSAR